MNPHLKKQIWLFVGILIIAGSFYHFFSSVRPGSDHQVLIGAKAINVEVAQTVEERGRGLSGHAPLMDNEGMFFVFPQPGQYGFWMKDMMYPIDIIWISADKKIVHIEDNISPDTYPQVFTPKEEAQYVLEVNTGLAKQNNWKEGDSVQF